MKESITKFDLEAAFKALDEIDTPKATKGIRANKPALTEIFSNKSKFDALFEEYYDISSTEELTDARNDRDAEVAKAKLARIEKIVDLNAESPDDLLPSYVGKYIVQCPQCMTLFYKDPEDIEESEDDPAIVNINEVCQHCGNESGYTLIGKVGAADEPAEEEPTEDAIDAEETAEEIPEDNEETTEEASDDDIDLDADIPDFAVEDDEEADEENTEEKTEEAFNMHEGNYLLEQLTEDSDLDITDAEFEELMNSSEFKNPISTEETDAMLKELGESKKNSNKEPLEETVETEEEDDELTEASFFKNLGKLGKAAIQGTKKTANKANNVFGELADKALDKSMTREEKADWVMTHTLNPDVKRIQLDNEGKMIPSQKDQKYDTYVVICYKDYFSDGDEITASPTYDNEDLVLGVSEPQFKRTYTEAEEVAKGWSMDQKGGPAMIFLTKGKEISACKYLCQFFKGTLDAKQDKLEELFQKAKTDIEGKEHITKGGGIKSDEGGKIIKKAVSELKPDDVVVIKGKNAKVIESTESQIQAGHYMIKFQYEDGTEDMGSFKGGAKISVVAAEATESFKAASELSRIMESLEEIKESDVEHLIAGTLAKNYKNVSGFKITGCSYLNEALTVDGKVVFKSGNTRNITYKFNKATSKANKIIFEGLSEKLGTDKNFVLTGKALNNTFIAESLTQVNNTNN
jgi:hypothetical protein